jgi:hypothetical protein
MSRAITSAPAECQYDVNRNNFYFYWGGGGGGNFAPAGLPQCLVQCVPSVTVLSTSAATVRRRGSRLKDKSFMLNAVINEGPA